MARTTALTQDYVYVHVVEDLILVEEVTSDGLHRFLLRPATQLLETVLGAALHPDAGDGRGDAVSTGALDPADPTPPDEVLAAAGAALVRCDLTVLSTDDPAPSMLGLFTAPGGSWVFESRHGTGEPVAVQPLPAERLRDRIVELVGAGTNR